MVHGMVNGFSDLIVELYGPEARARAWLRAW